MRKERIDDCKVARLELNEGQLPWLPRNPRLWTQDDIDGMKASIAEDPDFISDRPVLAVPAESGDKLVVFAHNLYTRAVTDLKIRTAPVVVYYPETDTDRETIRRRAMKDNGSLGSWDWEALANEWDDLPLTEWGIPAWPGENGKGAGENGSNDGGSGQHTETHEDKFDANKDGILVRCKPGDIWQLGDHRLCCGDSTDLETVKKLMGGGAIADMVFTDPPYGVAIGSKNAMLDATTGHGGRIKDDIVGDTLPVDDLYKVLQKAMENTRANTSDDACYFVCAPPGGDFGLMMMMMMMMRDAGLNVRHQIVWNKSSATFSLGRLDYDYKHEVIMYTWTKSHHNYRDGKFRTSVWDIPKPQRNEMHPTMKPVELVANCILDGSKEADIVLDPFGGSGTTMIAAEQLGRRCYMMEIDPHYCDVILARWEKETGRKAEKIN